MGPMIETPKGFLGENCFPINIEIKSQPLESVYNVDPRPFARGKFAQVKRCRHKQTGIEYAGKSIKKRRRSTDVRHEIIHEIGVLLLSYKNEGIVKLHEVYETPTEFILILEMVKGGELQRVLDEEECLPEKDVIRLMRQILKAVEFLHSNNIAHLDIKPQNLLLTSPLPDGDVKLCDFGISRLISDGVELREILGTPDYVAPEILHYDAIRLETDMWSIGVLTYVLLTGCSPFQGDTKQETYSNITNGNLEFGPEFDNISEGAIDFIKKLLVKDPKKRPTALECLEHSWLKESLSEPILEVPAKIEKEFDITTPTPIESNKENQAVVAEEFKYNTNNNDKSTDKSRDFIVLKMSPNEGKPLATTPCKRFIISSTTTSSSAAIEENLSTTTRSISSSERKISSSCEKSSTVLFESNSSISSFSSATTNASKPYHLVFREDLRDERVSFIY